uniref:Chromo domain-containing protein n=1 Tax=Acrobeloides nanus TaxID=290746 RepID=A0A914D4J5_9BILA
MEENGPLAMKTQHAESQQNVPNLDSQPTNITEINTESLLLKAIALAPGQIQLEAPMTKRRKKETKSGSIVDENESIPSDSEKTQTQQPQSPTKPQNSLGMSMTDYVLEKVNKIKDEIEQGASTSAVQDESDKPSEQADDEVYEVEKILKTKMTRGIRYFFVRWKGYDERYDTWEPEENLEGSPEIVKEFMEEYEKERKEKARKSGIASKAQIEKEKRAKEEKTEAGEREWTPGMEEDEDNKRRPKRSCVKPVSYEMPPSPTAYYRSFLRHKERKDMVSPTSAQKSP